jgi:hypothetical protein
MGCHEDCLEAAQMLNALPQAVPLTTRQRNTVEDLADLLKAVANLPERIGTLNAKVTACGVTREILGRNRHD